MKVSISILSLLVFCYFCGITESASIKREISPIIPRYSFCHSIFGFDACVNVNISNGQVFVKFNVGSVTVLDSIIDPSLSNNDVCANVFGISVCLKITKNGDNLCFGVRGSLPFLGSSSYDLGCIDIGFLGK